MPPKRKLTQDDMDLINKMFDENHRINQEQNDNLTDINRKVDQILFCLQGSVSMNIEGVIPAQKRMDKILQEINKWKSEMSLYMGIVTNGKVWRIVGIFIAAIGITLLSIKYGWHVAWETFVKIVKNLW